MILRRVIEHVKAQHWTAIAIDFVIVVVGVYIGLEVSTWNAALADRATEQRYLERLDAEASANAATLDEAIALHRRRAAILAAIATSLETDTKMPAATELSEVLCRWFVHPNVDLQRGVYAELLSSGRMALLRNEDLRDVLARESAAHAAADRLDTLAPILFEVASPLYAHREWAIVDSDKGRRGVTCRFDVAGMRADPHMVSVMAQLFRDQQNQIWFRESELKAVEATRRELESELQRAGH